jgi:LacI family transcriptional regulator
MVKSRIGAKPESKRVRSNAPVVVDPAIRAKNITINDIARLSGVSKKTVSRVINQSPFVKEDTRERVNSIIKQTGYAPNPQARALAFRKSFLIGLVYDNPNAEFVVNMQYGALDALRGSSFELVVHPCDRRSPEFLANVQQFVERQKLHGVILLPPISENAALLKVLRELDCPHVSIACVRIEAATHRVVSSDRDACAEAALHLAALGHRRIAVIKGPEGHRSTEERLSGFVEGLQKRGVQLSPELVVGGGYTFESGVQAAEMLLSVRNRPTRHFHSRSIIGDWL